MGEVVEADIEADLGYRIEGVSQQEFGLLNSQARKIGDTGNP